MQTVKIINYKAIQNAMNDCNNGKIGMLSNSDFEIEPEDIEPLAGYQFPKNNSTGKNFPDCCEWHSNVYKASLNWFKKFPECCEAHKKAIGQYWFNKENYNGIPIKIVRQLSYTEHCIINNIDKQDWYEAITEYFDWNIASFGQLPKGFGNPVGLTNYTELVKQYINNNSLIPNEKGKKLIDFLDSIYTEIKLTKQTDLNILKETYQKWLKIFPFELNSYFAEIKEYFESHLPILIDFSKTNRYNGITKAKVHTKSSLIEAIIKLTNNLLAQINGVTLYERGLISDINKIKIELVINSRKLKLEQGYLNKSPNEEQCYRNILKEWFSDEKKFFDELSTILKDKSSNTEKMELQKDAIIKPLKYMEFKKSVFFSNLIKQNNCSRNQAEKLYQLTIEILKQIKHLRNDEILTQEELNKQFAKVQNIEKSLLENWLLKAIQNDDSYVYTYNFLAQRTNRDMGYVVYPIKIILESKLINLIELEKKQKNDYNPSSAIKEKLDSKTFDDLQNIIIKGESRQLEFKSTLRVDLKTNKPEKYIEHSVIKTLAAFLNSDGGTLLIGVSDTKEILGLEPDFNSFAKPDKLDEFQKHFDNLLAKSIGNHCHHYIQVGFPEIEGKTICLVSIKEKSSEPVYITNEDGKETFFIRRLASTVELRTSETVKYTKEHWN